MESKNVKPDDAAIETELTRKKYGAADLAALALSTCGVGYIPIAPGTFGSAVGVVIYLIVALIEANIGIYLSTKGWRLEQISTLFFSANLVLLAAFCIAGIIASARTSKILNNKDPQKVVVDEVMGQLVVFLFIPFGVHWVYVFAGFLLFRLFDIWKPYPIRAFEDIPNGIGVCADDLVAGVYGGICLSIIYAVGYIW